MTPAVRWGRRLAGFAALALAAWIFTWTGGHLGATAADGNYAFSDVRVSAESAGVARVSYTLSWSTSTFPGVYNCTTTVFGPDGGIIGQNRAPLVSLQPTVQGAVPVPVSGVPASAAVSCDQVRLDRGPYSYTFSNVRAVVPGSDSGLAFSVYYDAAWDGAGTPGGVQCTLNVYSKTDNLLYSTPVDVLLMSQPAQDLQFRVYWDDLAGRLTAADLADIGQARFENCGPPVAPTDRSSQHPAG